MEELQKQNEILAGRLEKAKEVFKDQKKQIDDKNAKIAEQQDEINNLKEQLKNSTVNDELNNKLKEYEERVNELEGKWNDKVIENDDLALELNKAKNEAINNKNYAKDYEKKYNDKCDECEAQILELNKLNTMVAEGKKQYDKQVADNQTLTQQVHEANAALDEFKKVAENEINETKKKAAGEIDNFNKQLETANNDKEKLSADIQSLKNMNEQLRKQFETANKSLQDANGKLATVKNTNTDMQNQVKEMINNAQKLQTSLTSNFNIFQ